MITYFKYSPQWMHLLFPALIWRIKTNEKKLHLTFDDGPHPEITLEVLRILKQYKIKATFFCVGDNVRKFPQTFQTLLDEGHQVGNHTFNHLNGWKTSTKNYFENFEKAKVLIPSKLFRPAYGKISFEQIKQIGKESKIIMWSRLSADFDRNISKEKCFEICIKKPLKNGEIILFHDSEKAYERMIYALPKFIEFALEKGFSFELLNPELI